MTSAIQIFADRGLVRRDLLNWRVVRLVGAINGLPTCRGICVATNGIECLVDLPNGETFFGHFDFFVEDKDERVSQGKVNGERTSKRLTEKYQ